MKRVNLASRGRFREERARLSQPERASKPQREIPPYHIGFSSALKIIGKYMKNREKIGFFELLALL
jgi:hypothetical protein